MKRVWCLYRVSTKHQVSTDEDIPMQKNACHEFVKTKPGWMITNELYEKGVSGWKKTLNERDEMAVLKKAALHQEFDVLLVFMFDRLGRREDETPVMVNFLIQMGIEVWSVKEGQRKIESHVDKLLNYISFWQSDGESQKTSLRVKEAKKQLSEQGFFQGGTAPIGYKIVETNKKHWKYKERYIKELVPDEMEAEMVKLIYSLYVNKHMGYRKITDYLNEHGFRTREGKMFVVSTIKRILSNPIYIGKKRYKACRNGLQNYNKKLQIIPEELFHQAEQIRIGRTKKHGKSNIPRSGKLLFSGLAYCKYCGSKLTTNYLYKTSKNNKVAIYRYRCPLNKGKLYGNHEQTIWGGKKYDSLILNKINAILSQIKLHFSLDMSVDLLKLKEFNMQHLQKELSNLEKQQKKLKLEIGKSLLGESTFTPEQLADVLSHIENEINEKSSQIQSIMKKLENRLDTDFDNWEQYFYETDEYHKKALLSKIIHKVYFAKNEIEIEWNIGLSDYLKKSFN